MTVDFHLLPAPIAYVRHLVDVEDDNRAKFDQLRVLAQNTLQVMAAILLSDCLRLGLVSDLPTQPRAKRLAVGDFVTSIIEAASLLMSQLELCYVPELVRLYGEKNKVARQRRERLQRIVVNRNRDAHTASLAQSNTWLNELVPDVYDTIQELDCLRAYMMVSAKNVELAPDRDSSHLNGLVCHGFSDRYVSVKLPIVQTVSRCEVILIKVERSEWLSLRPWFLYVWDYDESLTTGAEELALLNAVDDRRLSYIGLISGTEYQLDSEWRMFTMYELEATRTQPSTYTEGDASQCEHQRSVGLPVEELDAREPSRLLKRLAATRENILVSQRVGSEGEEYLVSIRTPVREVAVASVDQSGSVQIFSKMLERAMGEGLLEKSRFQKALDDLGQAKAGRDQVGRSTAGYRTTYLNK